MGKEIERKFLIDMNQWQILEKPRGYLLRQGYLVADPDKTVRVRITPENAFLTIKGRTTLATRSEFEYEIPIDDAMNLLQEFAVTELSKIRYEILHKDKLWEVDEFLGDNNGLIVAEIELLSEDEAFEKPLWVKEEVTGDKKYYNACLITVPYKSW